MKKGLLCFAVIFIFVVLGQAAYAQPAFIWEKNTELQAGNLYAVCFANNMFVAVGYDGAIKISSDGDKWTAVDFYLNCYLYDVTYADGRFIAAGSGGTVITSKDGVNWTQIDIGIKEDIRKILWNGERYLAITESKVIGSLDGETWQELPVNVEEKDSIACGNNNFVILRRNGKILTSTDGQEWVEKYSLPEGVFYAVTYNENKFVAIGEYTKKIIPGIINRRQYVLMTSQDGDNWLLQDIENSDVFNDIHPIKGIAWSGKKYVIVGGFNDYIILSSEDGSIWNEIKVDAPINDVAYGNGMFVAVGSVGVIMSSNDGIHWVKRDKAVMFDFCNIIWQDNRFIAAGSNRAHIFTSEDGKTWNIERVEAAGLLSAIAWNGQKHVIQGSWGIILTSTDGVNWELYNMGDKICYSSMVWDGEKFVAVGDEGLISTSSDGLHWIERNSGLEDDFWSIAWNGELFVAVGSSNLGMNSNRRIILTSPDGINWTKTLLEIDQKSGFNSVIWGGGQFVAVGGYGLVMTSPDGINWTSRTTGITNSINDITWIGNMYVAAADFGVILTSLDGINWSIGFAPTGVSLTCIEWNGEQLVAVGYISTILTTIPKDVVKVKVNDKPIIFDVAPVISEGRTLVPLRYIFEALGAEVKWDAATRTVTGIKGSDEIVLNIDSKDAVVNGETRKPDVPATILNGRTLVPARFISESLGAEVLWDGDSKTVIIKTE